MTNEERISRLERQVRSFKIRTAGDGDLEGGFGALIVEGDNLERLTNLENAVGKFELAGNNVQVSGSFDTGYILT